MFLSLPCSYLALYTYRPLKEDELELRKGELYTVSENAKMDGSREHHFEQDLVEFSLEIMFKLLTVMQPHIGVSIAGRTSPAQSTTSPPPTSGVQVQQRTSFSGVTTENPHLFHPISTQGVIYTNSPITLCGRVPATSTSPVSPAHPAVLEWAHSIAVGAPLQRLQRPVSSVGAFSPAIYKSEIGSKQNGFPCVQSRPLAMAPWTSLCAIDFNSSPSSSQIVTDFPVRTTSASPTRMLSYQASPNTSMGSHNQGISNAASESGSSQPRYSISQPSTPLMMPHIVPPNTNPFVTPDRVGCSTPVTSGTACSMSAQTSQARVEKHKEKKEKEIVSLMKRLTKRKSKSPPPSDYSCDNPSFVDGTSSQQSLSAVHVRSTSCPSEALGSQVNHKKTGSLDGSNGEVPKSSSRPKQPAPLVRERFRCIVPYPPNSDYELELKVGDVVYVHKKREDGWYKGTLQRTGKTGLFHLVLSKVFDVVKLHKMLDHIRGCIINVANDAHSS
ncbi:e3 ubiquitin-protein ligase SH3RF3 [Caerostris extrusa]|uniref:RING-type E3 ubiquitin transferase n=1 Tax=Caerostris extrusa TaxID=172846 RepID=A0AAV4P6V6_CAEEX|nr:e3 ubiquitin-protein ligase SH3RF3 [Caerostris extrusa]